MIGDSASLTRPSTVRDLVAAWQRASDDVRRHFAAIIATEQALNAQLGIPADSTDRIRIEASRHTYSEDFTNVDECLGRMRRQMWGFIVERLELRRMLSISRYAELERHLERGELAEITDASVVAFVRRYAEDLPSLLAESVREVFDWLRPWRSEHKTNSKYEIGRKVVLTRVVDSKWISRPGFQVEYQSRQNLVALENVFSALDGRGSICKEHVSRLERAICESGAAGRGATEYFAFRCFHNGNLHLEFLRPDLLARLNQVAGGARLKPATEAA